jgi:hypothetical protein
MNQKVIFCVFMVFNYLYAADEKSEAEQEIDISTLSR